jgi:aminopeptidase N
MKKILFFFFVIVMNPVMAQYSKGDSLRGSINANRSWWDVQRYMLTVSVDINEKTISGSNTIVFKTLQEGKIMQVDLQDPLQLDSVKFHGLLCTWTHTFNAWMIALPESSFEEDSITIYYSGKPRPAKFPPWDGGISWKKDDKGRPWVGVSCQGLGASVWWPNKDHQYDEPDNGMIITITIPDSLVNISNGKLLRVVQEKGKRASYVYGVKNPINNYDVTMNIGNYVTVRDSFSGKNGMLQIEYALLDYNQSKVETHLQKDTRDMLSCFEYWFGAYPFYVDGYRLVETSYLGMEHQSAIAYGNKFRKGYMGTDRSRTGIGLLWDFIIVHESGHEWFGNNITCKDNADMWIHEGFTTYSEVLFVQCGFGIDSANRYLQGLRRNILNDKNMIGDYGVNREGSNDIYDKGAAMIHTIRQIINNDSLFRAILIGMNTHFAKKTVSTEDIENFWIEKSGKNLKPLFNQYLRTTNIPVLNYKYKGNTLYYYFSNCSKDFQMPVKMLADNGVDFWIDVNPAQQKTKIEANLKNLKPDANFYIKPTRIK